jgi:hypothetical protein
MSLDVPVLGTRNEQYALSYEPCGLDASMFYTGLLNNLTIFANYRYSYVMGNELFYCNLDNGDTDGFPFSQLSFGLAINSTFRVSWTTYFGDEFINDNLKSAVSFSIIPQ